MHLDFIKRIHAAPVHTREWLLMHFSQCDEQNDAGTYCSEDSKHDDMPMMSVKSVRGSCDYTSTMVARANSSSEVVDLIAKAGKFDFDALEFASKDHVQGHCIGILGVELERRSRMFEGLERSHMIASQKQVLPRFLSFLGKLDMLYKPDALYHGSAHAADVMSTAAWFMQSTTMTRISSELDEFMVLVSAAIHDVSHPGVNNLMLQKTMDPIAIRYNDRSCLEQMHLAIAFELMQTDPESNWFEKLLSVAEFNTQQHVRKSLVSMVLATDMAKHAEHVQQLQSLISQKGPDDVCSEDKQFLLATLLHASDISNPTKPRKIMLSWTELILKEFWAQGDAEVKCGVPVSPLCDRAAGKAAVPQGQLGFINFVVSPYVLGISHLLPDCQEAVDGLEASTSFWQELQQKKSTYEDIFGSATEASAE